MLRAEMVGDQELFDLYETTSEASARLQHDQDAREFEIIRGWLADGCRADLPFLMWKTKHWGGS